MSAFAFYSSLVSFCFPSRSSVRDGRLCVGGVASCLSPNQRFLRPFLGFRRFVGFVLFCISLVCEMVNCGVDFVCRGRGLVRPITGF